MDRRFGDDWNLARFVGKRSDFNGALKPRL
jgi:hypothetical protein